MIAILKMRKQARIRPRQSGWRVCAPMIKNPYALLPLRPLCPQGLASVASGVQLWSCGMEGALTWALPAWGQEQEPKTVTPTG